MESAKIQTWSAEELNPETAMSPSAVSPVVASAEMDDAFVPISLDQLAVVHLPESATVADQAGETDKSPFAIDPNILSSLRTDPGVEREIGRLVNELVEKKHADSELEWKAEAEKLRMDARNAGHEQGMREGREEAARELTTARSELVKDFNERLYNRLDSLCSGITTEKAALMHEHEQCWVKATQHLMTRFQVANSARIGKALEGWISGAVREFADKGKVKIYLSPDEYAAFLRELSGSGGTASAGGRWELLSDSDLKAGESRYECDGGGIFFSKEEGFQKIDKWVEAVSEST